MIRYSAAVSSAFDVGFRRWRASRLHVQRIDGLPQQIPLDRPLVMVANHTSWWDGFLLRDVHAALRPRRPIYTVMTERELQRHRFLGLLGAVPLEPGSPSSMLRLLRTLRSAVEREPDVSVVFFPQGRIWPSARRPLGFQRGVELLLKQLGPCYVLPIGIHIEPLNRAAPTAFLSVADVRRVPEDSASASDLEQAVQERLDDTAALLARYGETVVSTDMSLWRRV